MIRGAALALVVLTSATGCHCSGERAQPKPKIEPIERAQPTRTAPRARPGATPAPTPTRAIDPPARVPQLALDEAADAMPSLGARALEPPAVAPNGSQIQFSYCLDAGGVAPASTSLTEKLAAAGWTDVTTKGGGDPTTNARTTVMATKDDLRLRFMLQATTVEGCDGTAGQVHARAFMGRVAMPTP